MNNQEKMDIIISFQDNPLVHPLTCGRGGHKHRDLIPAVKDNVVILVCLDCSYWQPLHDDFIESLAQLDFQQRQVMKMTNDNLGVHQ